MRRATDGTPRRRRLPGVLLATATVASGLVAVVAPSNPVAAVANPPIADSCGVDVTLVLDASGSISSSHAVDTVRRAADSFLDSLINTNSTARVIQFGTLSAQLAPRTVVDTTSLASGGALRNAVDGYYNPRPPRPNGVNLYQYTGSNPSNSTSFRLSNNTSSEQYTNWEQTLKQANTEPSDLVVFITDGDPTGYDFRAGDPFGPPAVAFGTDRNSAGSTLTLNRAVEAADALKGSGSRMLTIGVGSALSNQASVERLKAVTGPQVKRDADIGTITSLNDVDVALVTEFNDLAEVLRGVVLQLCSPSLTVRKLAQTSTDGSYQPAASWAMTATPTTVNGRFNWILPDATPAVSKTLATDSNGFAQFQWEPDPGDQDSSATVSEAIRANYDAGRPSDDDWRCEARDEKGNLRIEEGDLTVAGSNASFALDPIGQEIVTCTVWNSYDYQPDIRLTKVNVPTDVRGDLTPEATVTSTFDVVNPGNTSLRNITVTDDKCSPVAPVLAAGRNVGDTTPANGLLDPGETWRFTCTTSVSDDRVNVGTTPLNIVNTATVLGIDPVGTTVTATATDDVDVYVPRIELIKLVDGEKAVNVPPSTDVTYTYSATNTGNTPLGTITLTDDTPPCTNPTPVTNGNGDTIMDVGETWTWSCTGTPDTATTSDITNTATVIGTPLDPANANVPFPGPTVSDTDTARVFVVDAGITLTKVANPTRLVLDVDTATTGEVTYTFTATNQGNVPLNRIGAGAGPPSATDPGWVLDSQCLGAVSYVSGDTPPTNAMLDPGETWTFTCSANVGAPTTNVAIIIGVPSNADGTPISNLRPVGDLAAASVDVVRPGIGIVKTTSTPVVLSTGMATPPIAGPDASAPRPARYRYEVSNEGSPELPLDISATPTDDKCIQVVPELQAAPNEVYNTGDTDRDQLVDVGETWVYTCEIRLNRTADSNVAPVGNRSGLVENTASVTGVPVYQETRYPGITAADTAQVLVIEPGVTLTKTPSSTIAQAGDDITYTYVVGNAGDVGLSIIGPGDDLCTDVVPTVQNAPNEAFNIGDLDRDDLLDGANSGAPEQWTFTCVQTMGLPEPPATTIDNTATVIGIDPLGNAYEAVATASVRVFDPAIHLTKTVSESLVPVGTTVTYDFAVTNTGQSPIATDDVLANLVLADAASPATPTCDAPAYISGDVAPLGQLTRDPAETWIYRCSAAISEPTVNVAGVRGTAGTPIGLPRVDVFDFAAAFVQTFTPAIDVIKSASPTDLAAAGPVTYTYEVRNTGDAPLGNVSARITDDKCAPVTYVSGDDNANGLLDTPSSIFEDAADEVWTFTCLTSIAQTTTNTVVVTGTPTDGGGVELCGPPPSLSVAAYRITQPCDVTDQTQAVVTVRGTQPPSPGSITVVKRTSAPTTDTFRFTTGTDDFTIPSGGTHTTNNLLPGSYVVSEAATVGWQLSLIRCTDASGAAIGSRNGQTVRIDLPPGGAITCTFTNTYAGTLPSTGNGPFVPTIILAVFAVGLGGVLLLAATRRQRSVRSTA